MDSSTPGFPVHLQLHELPQTHVHRVSDDIQPSHSLSSPSPPAPNSSQHQERCLFSKESVLCIRWPKYWSFSFSISPSNVYSGLISFRIDHFDLIAVQGTLKSHLQHAFWCLQKHQFFHAQLSLESTFHIHAWQMEKNIALTRWTFVGKVMSLLFNMLSKFNVV